MAFVLHYTRQSFHTPRGDISSRESGKMVESEPIELAEIIEKNGAVTSIISALEEVQSRYHYLPKEAMILVSERLECL